MEKSPINRKKELRRSILLKRDALTEEERGRAALILTERILGHQWFYRSEIILGFVNYGSEISTREILEEALKAGKKVYVPKIVQVTEEGDFNLTKQCKPDGGCPLEMRFYKIESLADLKEGYKGIPEPDGATEEYIYHAEEAENTLMLMPGVVFDMFRNRIGYGKGFYDRYLADKEVLQLRSIGVGYKCQMVEEIPAEENDIKPYQVIVV